jgi:adenine-specific DNA-methyltransferase
VDEILEIVGPPEDGDGFFVDAFCGTGVVGAKASELGWPVRLNDHLLSAVIISSARLLGSDAVPFVHFGGYTGAVARLNAARPRHGFLWREYSPASLTTGAGVERRYFTEENAAKLDGLRAELEEWAVEGWVSEDEKLLLLADLLAAANRVANIAGTYGCFMRRWLGGALKPVAINPRQLLQRSAQFEVHNVEVDDVPITEGDLAYLDPPYTKRHYAAYYHILETIAHGDEPLVDGIALLYPRLTRQATAACGKTEIFETVELPSGTIYGVAVEARGISARGGFQTFSRNIASGVVATLGLTPPAAV